MTKFSYLLICTILIVLGMITVHYQLGWLSFYLGMLCGMIAMIGRKTKQQEEKTIMDISNEYPSFICEDCANVNHSENEYKFLETKEAFEEWQRLRASFPDNERDKYRIVINGCPSLDDMEGKTIIEVGEEYTLIKKEIQKNEAKK
jgi:hypothetical protein